MVFLSEWAQLTIYVAAPAIKTGFYYLFPGKLWGFLTGRMWTFCPYYYSRLDKIHQDNIKETNKKKETTYTISYRSIDQVLLSIFSLQTNRHIRLRELLLQHSKDASLIVM